MSLKPILVLLNYLEKATGTNDKISLLMGYLDNPVFRRVVQYAYNQGQTYNVNDAVYIPESTNNNIENIFSHLTYMHNKGGANMQDKEKLNWAASIDEETVEVVRRIVTKDLRCGISHKTIENARKGVVEFVPYQRCSSETSIKNVNYPAFVQKKADSMFSYAMPWKDENIFTTRNGNSFGLFGNLKRELSLLLDGRKSVLVGELQVLDENYENVLDRKTGNGYLNSFIQGTGDPDIAKRVIYDVWDIIPFECYEKKLCTSAYQMRFLMLIDMIEKWSSKCYETDTMPPVGIIPYTVVHNEKEARDFYKKMRRAGFEGAILKDFSEKWRPTTSTKFVKLKNRGEAEFEIVDAYYGKEGKSFENVLGGITVKSSDGKILTNVGTGFTEEDRNKGVEWWKEQIGKIVTIAFESVIEDKTSRKTMKLFLPGFVEERFNEKTEADTLQYCLDQCVTEK